MESNENEKSVWQKNQSELTITESMTIALVVGTAVAVLPLAAVYGVEKVGELRSKRTARKVQKQAEKILKKEGKIINTTCKVKD
jgi:hypothetical protein